MKDARLSNMNRVNDLCLFVKDFTGALRFFTEKFGFTLKRLQPDAEHANYAEFEFAGTSVTLWDAAGAGSVIDPAYIEGEGHHFMIAIKVPRVEEVNDIHAALTERGVVCIREPTDFAFGSRAAYFLDHEKNIWEIFAWHEGNGPGLL
jgi:catechol 2,3-dioxygenase-like lactoylglutathione lyase family enzyme